MHQQERMHFVNRFGDAVVWQHKTVNRNRKRGNSVPLLRKQIERCRMFGFIREIFYCLATLCKLYSLCENIDSYL